MTLWNYPEPIFSLIRGNFNEVTVFGEIVVVDHKGVVFNSAESVGTYAARSLLKPYQLMATGKPGKDWVGNSPNRTMVACGSISATAEQVSQLRDWYSKEELNRRVPHLVFDLGYPTDEINRVVLRKNGEKPSPFYHPCFSKHMMILEGCERAGDPLENYHHANHPYQKRLSALLAETLNQKASEIEWVNDGCLLPSPVFTLEELARLYQRMTVAAEDSALLGAGQMMSRFPQWIGGPGRVDTKLMELSEGRLFAKEGADGLLGLGVFPCERFPKGAGIIVKTSAGYQPDWAGIALNPLLQAMGIPPYQKTLKGHEVHYHYRPFESKRAKVSELSPLLSGETAVWPGDVPFQREVGCSTDEGSHMTLSSVRTTLHVGTHTDAPNHFEPSAPGIDQVDAGKYWGPCQVISVKVERNSVIRPEDLMGTPIRATRVIFKTETFPNPNHFNEDFAALSPELVDYLADRGVVMVGLDTPSVDSFSSKTLDAHKRTIARGMGILEGIILDKIPDGIYELSAVPLRLKNGDASPVRAILKSMQ